MEHITLHLDLTPCVWEEGEEAAVEGGDGEKVHEASASGGGGVNAFGVSHVTPRSSSPQRSVPIVSGGARGAAAEGEGTVAAGVGGAGSGGAGGRA
ncbi:unnamed protein product [Closterium sp. NIES-54]